MVRLSTRKRKAYVKVYYKHNREKIQVPSEEKKEANKVAYEARAQNTLRARKKYSLLSEEIKGARREKYASDSQEREARRGRYDAEKAKRVQRYLSESEKEKTARKDRYSADVAKEKAARRALLS